MPATKTFLEGMTNLALKKLKKLKKQADRDVAKEEKLSEKKFHPNESAEMDDLAEARYKANSIADELYKGEEKIKKGKFSKSDLNSLRKSLKSEGMNSGGRLSLKKPKKYKKLKVDQKPKKRATPIDPRDIFIEGPRTTGGRKGGRGMGKALRGGGKVMRG